MSKLKKRYLQDESNQIGFSHDLRSATACHALLAKCSFLDPRYKGQITANDNESAKSQLMNEIEANSTNEGKNKNY